MCSPQREYFAAIHPNDVERLSEEGCAQCSDRGFGRYTEGKTTRETTVSVTHKATSQARPRLFGQSQK